MDPAPSPSRIHADKVVPVNETTAITRVRSPVTRAHVRLAMFPSSFRAQAMVIRLPSSAPPFTARTDRRRRVTSCVTMCRIADVPNIAVWSRVMRGFVRSVRSRRTSCVSVERRKRASSVGGKGRMKSSAEFGRVGKRGRGVRGLAVEGSADGFTIAGSMNATRYVVLFRLVVRC